MTIGSIEGIFCLFFLAFDCEERQYLLAGIGRQVEGEDGQKGDAHARDDEVDGVEERLAAHRDVERDVQVGLDAARVVLFPSAFQNTIVGSVEKRKKQKGKQKGRLLHVDGRDSDKQDGRGRTRGQSNCYLGRPEPTIIRTIGVRGWRRARLHEAPDRDRYDQSGTFAIFFLKK